MIHGSWIALIAGLTWAALVMIAVGGIWRYSRRVPGALGFWQFTIKQAITAFSLCTLLVWMVYSWCHDRFG